MPEFSPYQNSHIYLDNQYFKLPDSLFMKNGNYVVFWWRQIAIGDAYITPGFSLNQNNYLKLLIDSITPAISFYASNFDNKKNWISFIEDNKIDEFSSFMDKIYRPYISRNTPRSVPVSVVICTRNRPEQLQKCLKMLEQLATAPKEIIVVDNAPDDMQSHSVVNIFKDVTYIKEPRKGLDIARNRGVKAASQPIVTFVDDDVSVHPHCIFRVWETFQNESVSAMTGLVIAKELESVAQILFEKYWSFNRGYQDAIYDESFIKSSLRKGPPVWEIGAGANMAFRRDIFEHVGLFDERLDVGAAGCSGDSEMWYRILVHGFTIKYNPRAIVYHLHRREMKALKKQLFSYMRGHTAAALFQHNFVQPVNYRRHIFINLPRYYMRLIQKGFPRYKDRFSTIFSEIKGVVSGIIFYLKNRKKPARIEE